MDIHIPTNTKKKKVAIFANSHTAENLYNFLNGLKDSATPESVDFFLFMTQSLYSYSDMDNKCLNAIFDLPDLSTFDAAILFTPGLNFPDLIEKMVVKLSNSGIPIISVGLEYNNFYSVTVDNYVGMKALSNHLIEDHNITDILYVAGSSDNADSNARLQALTDACKEHNIPFGEDNILYTNWEVGLLLHHIYTMANDNIPLPQAFVCANDLLAQTISYALEDCNYPDYTSQVITGFDYIEQTRAFYPSLASVDQQPDEQGRQAGQILNKIFNNESAPLQTKVTCTFHPGESCGCFNTREENKLRQSIARHTPRRFMENSLIDNLFSSIAREILHCEDYDSMKNNLHNMFYFGDGREGSTFYLILDHYYMNTTSASDLSSLPKYTFSDKMDTIVAKSAGKPVYTQTIDTAQLLPGYTGIGANTLYIFTPLYYENIVCGYIVFADKYDWIKQTKFTDMITVLKNSFVTLRSNMELHFLNQQLSMLMDKDSLTSVKNRNAYDKYVADIEQRISNNECSPFAIICFDINSLKEVNDKLGHEKGDIYIKNCCKYICDSFKHSPVFRIGGDEFVTILFDDDYNNRNALLDTMRDGMDQLSKLKLDLYPTEQISIASGMSEYAPGSSDSFSDIFKWADEKMYQRKYIMKNGRIR